MLFVNGYIFWQISVVIPSLTFICYRIAEYIMYLDLNKRIYNHVPGECSNMATLVNGSVDIHLLSSMPIALISTGLQLYNRSYPTTQRGIIFAYNISSRTVWQLTIATPMHFNPHGLSVFERKSDQAPIVFIVNHDRTDSDTIEVFRFAQTEREKQLVHMRTIEDRQQLRHIRDVVALDSHRFYATRHFYYDRPSLQSVETMLALRYGSIVYFNGKNISQVVDGIASPVGIAYDKKRRFIFVASFTHQQILVYRREDDYSLVHNHTIDLQTSPYNIAIDAISGNLYVACHQLKLRFVRHELAPQDNLAPSQVLRIYRHKKAWKIVQMYANDGATISGATVAVRVHNQLMIGSAFNNLLICNIDH